MAHSGRTEAWLVYDGECPFCRRYVQLIRLRENVRLHLVDAREDDALVGEMRENGVDLDEGMVLKWAERYHHGGDCIHVLALLSTPSTRFNRLNAWIFRSPGRSRWLYPVLRAGRNAALAMLGRTKIRDRAQDA